MIIRASRAASSASVMSDRSSRDCFSREMQIHALCRPAVAAVQQLHRGIQAAAVGAGRTVDERLMAGLRLGKAA